MTVGTLTLLDDAEIESAAQILKGGRDELIRSVHKYIHYYLLSRTITSKKVLNFLLSYGSF